MKHFLFVLAIVPLFAMAKQMEGFGANYYNDSSVTNYDVTKNLVPDVIVGDEIYTMEFSSLTDIAKTAGVSVNKGEQASWLCLSSKNVNYWFISDNEMGQGNLTSIAISKGNQENCSSYSDELSVIVKGFPLLDNVDELSNKENDVIQYCADTKKYGDFTQMNCLRYYVENKNIQGVLISQITSN